MLKKYRAVLLLGAFLFFNIAESLYFGQGTPKGVNATPASVSEWVCDAISIVGIFWAVIMGMYDVNSTKRHFVLTTQTGNNEKEGLNAENKDL